MKDHRFISFSYIIQVNTIYHGDTQEEEINLSMFGGAYDICVIFGKEKRMENTSLNCT